MTWQMVLTVCGGITTIVGAIAGIKKLLSPLTDLNDRVAEVEAHDKKDMERFIKIDERFEVQKNQNQAILKALYAVMGHYIDGNSIESMKKARAALVEHIIEN